LLSTELIDCPGEYEYDGLELVDLVSRADKLNDGDGDELRDISGELVIDCEPVSE
jgi:hypothetical protein